MRQAEPEQTAWADLLEPLGAEAQKLWGWDNVLDGMKKSEKFSPVPKIEGEMHEGAKSRKHTLLPYKASSHGTSGPIHHSWPAVEFASVGAFLQSSQTTLGLPVNHDPYNGNNSGPFLSMSSINPTNWTRSFARTGYLDPLDRPNLHVLTGHQATKVLFDGAKTPRATGVQFATSAKGKVRSVKATKEVILAAGVIGSPQLLQLSGVADKSILDPLKIKQVADVPGVGFHLQDHLSGAVTFAPKGGAAMPAKKVTGDAKQDSFVNGAVAYTPLSKLMSVDRIVHNVTSSIDRWVGKYDAPSTVKEGYRAVLKQVAKLYSLDVPAVEILFSISWGNLNVQCGLQHPTSQGSVKITSTSAFDEPAIDAAYVRNTIDMQVLRHGCQMARKIGTSAPLSDYVGNETSPGTNVQSNGAWNAYIKKNFGTEYHPSSSCSQLPLDLGGVVDERLNVYNTKGLRVIDSSVPPLSMSQHLMTITYGLAEIGAELILEDNE